MSESGPDCGKGQASIGNESATWGRCRKRSRQGRLSDGRCYCMWFREALEIVKGLAKTNSANSYTNLPCERNLVLQNNVPHGKPPSVLPHLCDINGLDPDRLTVHSAHVPKSNGFVSIYRINVQRI